MKSNIYFEIVRQNLKLYRDFSGLSQYAFAEKTLVSSRYYQKLESGEANPTIDILVKISTSLEISLDHLIRLNYLRIPKHIKSFIESIEPVFQKAEYSVGVRSLEGKFLWANDRVYEIHKDLKSESMIADYLPAESKDILAMELKSEKKMMPSPYLVKSKGTKGEEVYYKVFPTLLFEEKSKVPSMAITYSTPNNHNPIASYLDYIENLFQICGLIEAPSGALTAG